MCVHVCVCERKRDETRSLSKVRLCSLLHGTFDLLKEQSDVTSKRERERERERCISLQLLKVKVSLGKHMTGFLYCRRKTILVVGR